MMLSFVYLLLIQVLLVIFLIRTYSSYDVLTGLKLFQALGFLFFCCFVQKHLLFHRSEVILKDLTSKRQGVNKWSLQKLPKGFLQPKCLIGFLINETAVEAHFFQEIGEAFHEVFWSIGQSQISYGAFVHLLLRFFAFFSDLQGSGRFNEELRQFICWFVHTFVFLSPWPSFVCYFPCIYCQTRTTLGCWGQSWSKVASTNVTHAWLVLGLTLDLQVGLRGVSSSVDGSLRLSGFFSTLEADYPDTSITWQGGCILISINDDIYILRFSRVPRAPHLYLHRSFLYF